MTSPRRITKPPRKWRQLNLQLARAKSLLPQISRTVEDVGKQRG